MLVIQVHHWSMHFELQLQGKTYIYMETHRTSVGSSASRRNDFESQCCWMKSHNGQRSLLDFTGLKTNQWLESVVQISGQRPVYFLNSKECSSITGLEPTTSGFKALLLSLGAIWLLVQDFTRLNHLSEVLGSRIFLCKVTQVRPVSALVSSHHTNTYWLFSREDINHQEAQVKTHFRVF